MKRRTVLWMGVGAVGALAVGWSVLPPRQRMTGGVDRLADPQSFTPNAWVGIGRDNSITLFMPRAEMGQGTHTGLAMLLAEELGCALEVIRIAPAPIASVYNNVKVAGGSPPLSGAGPGLAERLGGHFSAKLVREIGFMVTGGSSSIADLWEVLREAGALTRETLRQAAARHWGVPLAACLARNGQIVREDGTAMDYGAIVALGEDALQPAEEVPLKAAKDWQLIGTPARRLEAADKVTGAARFAADIHEPGMLFAELELCPYREGTLEVFDEAAVRAMPGVADVIVIAGEAPAPAAIVVLADQRWRAQRAVAAVGARWRPGPAGVFEQSMIDETLVSALDERAEAEVYRDIGDARQVLGTARNVIRAEFEVPYLAHAAMEPLCCAVKYTPDNATIWVGTQNQNVARDVAAKFFDLDKDRVTLVPLLLGGGFGRRLDSDFVALGAAIGRAAPGSLVQVQWRREHDMRHDFYRPAVRARLAAALDPATGLVSAYESRSAGQSIGAQAMPRQLGLPASGKDPSNVEGAADQPYAYPHHRVVHAAVDLPVGVGYWRSVGHSQQAFFTESFMDELAAAANADPVEFRLRHLGAAPRHAAVLRFVAQKAGWGVPLESAADGRPKARGVALHESFGSIVGMVVEVSVDEDSAPRVHRVIAAIDCGTAINPNLIHQQLEGSIVFGLSAALYDRISFKGGVVEQGNFDSYPILRLADTPAIETWILPSSEPPGGVGEPGVPPVAPAVANALAALTGRRQRRLPLSGA